MKCYDKGVSILNNVLLSLYAKDDKKVVILEVEKKLSTFTYPCSVHALCQKTNPNFLMEITLSTIDNTHL